MKDMLVKLYDLPEVCSELEEIKKTIDFRRPLAAEKYIICDWVEKNFGKIDIFVNNAGIAGINTTVADYPLDEWKKVMNLNLNSVFYCCKAVVPFMTRNNYGRIVNIASIAGKEGNPNASAYSTSKAGVLGLTKSLGKELAQKNIAVNCVTPAAA